MGKKRITVYVLAVVVALCIIFLPSYSELHKLREENEQLQRRIVLLEGHNEKLKEELQKMKQDPDYVEKRAREKLGIIKKGEIIYRKGEKTQ